MEDWLRAALITWLRNDSSLEPFNAIEEESPLSVSPPWLGLAASAASDWSTKTRRGREVRIALEIEVRSDRSDDLAALSLAVEHSVLSLPRTQASFEVASIAFLRSRSERRPRNRRAALLEFRFRLFEL
jgi:hypothetical protein